MPELQLDGIVGPTHNYAGLSRGNLASLRHAASQANPRLAARQGLEKMRLVRDLGGLQGVLPPHPRPSVSTLRSLGFSGSDESVIAAAGATEGGLPLRHCCSASAMWAANAATVTSSSDSTDGKVHITPANLVSMFHRAIEARQTARVLRAIFAHESFAVHDPLPGGGQFADEGAANHLRLPTADGALHVFSWGRSEWQEAAHPSLFPARQTLEASRAVARLHRLRPDRCVFLQQHPAGIDAGAFHTDVLAASGGRLLMLHELAYSEHEATFARLQAALGAEVTVVRATNAELPVQSAVSAYPFNSQLIERADGKVVILAPEDAREDDASRRFLERVEAFSGPVAQVRYVDVRQSMQNGGGPACLRLRVPLEEGEASRLGGRILLDDALYDELCAWVDRRYRDRLSEQDLGDPALAREGLEALDELTRILALGSLYDFQRG